ncbi:hypothetical protein JXB37_08375 [candidate division WOR-3 bacterium]|nr:hypothetical protein [candidate division WOR-3 bacterium]
MAHKRPDRRRAGKKKREFPGWVLWAIIGVVAVFALVMLARTLTTATNPDIIIPVLASANPDLTALTRMMGDIEPDTAGFQPPEDLAPRFLVVDSLVAERDWPTAIDRLRSLVKPAPADKLAYVHELLGYCYYQSAAPDRALNEFRKEIAAAGSNSSRQFRAAFCAGYLFQSRGFADSALVFYQQARHFAPEDSADPLLPATLNNLGLAYEATGDSTAALTAYGAAAALLDTTADSRAARVLRDNLRRLEPVVVPD